MPIDRTQRRSSRCALARRSPSSPRRRTRSACYDDFIVAVSERSRRRGARAARARRRSQHRRSPTAIRCSSSRRAPATRPTVDVLLAAKAERRRAQPLRRHARSWSPRSPAISTIVEEAPRARRRDRRHGLDAADLRGDRRPRRHRRATCSTRAPNINAVSPNGTTALMMAVREGKGSTVDAADRARRQRQPPQRERRHGARLGEARQRGRRWRRRCVAPARRVGARLAACSVVAARLRGSGGASSHLLRVGDERPRELDRSPSASGVAAVDALAEDRVAERRAGRARGARAMPARGHRVGDRGARGQRRRAPSPRRPAPRRRRSRRPCASSRCAVDGFGAPHERVDERVRDVVEHRSDRASSRLVANS